MINKNKNKEIIKQIIKKKKNINDNKINDNKIIYDNDNNFHCISIIIKLKKKIVPIKDINSILKINKKVCSQVYLEECNFINDSYNKDR